MKQGVWAVYTNPTSPAEEEEYNRWYSEVHIHELVEIEGIVGATRYRVVSDDASHRYVALYHLEGDDLQTVVARVSERSAAGGFTPTSTLQKEPGSGKFLFEQIASVTALVAS
jgi:hypothetical protein